MRNVQTIGPFLALFLGALVILTGCGSKADKAPSAEKAATAGHDKPAGAKAAGSPEAAHGDEKLIKLSAEEMKAAGVKVAVLQPEALNDRLALTATIQANQDKLARVAPRVTGRIVAVNANLGDRVRAGQTLAMLDSIEVGEAQSTHAQARSELQLAQKNMQRAEKLRAEQIIPEKDYLRAQAETEKARAILLAANQKLQALGVPSASSADARVSVFPVVAPFAGMVIEKKAVNGELAQPDKPIYTVADLSEVWIEASIFEKDVGKVKVGALAEITVAAYPGEIFKGRVRYVGNTMDRETRTARSLIAVPNKDDRLKLDMFANAAILTGSSVQALAVPEEAVTLIQGQPTVFIAEVDGFETRPVALGDKVGGRVVVKSGISPGDRVVVEGAYALKAKLLKSQIGDAH